MENVFRFVLSRDDLTRLAVVGAADPLTEVQSAAHRFALGRYIDAPAAAWAQRTAAALGPTGALIMDVLGSGIAVCSDLGQHGERFSVEFDDFANSIRRVPRRVWELEIAGLVDWGVSPGRPAEMAHDAMRIAQFAAVVERFQDVAVRPYWGAISTTIASYSGQLAQRLSFGDTAAVLNGLHPDVTWNDPILSIRVDQDILCAPNCVHRTIDQSAPPLSPQPLDGRGLMLVPSVLTNGVGVYVPEDADSDGRPWELAFPVPWDWTTTTNSHRTALADLLGVTRATVLDSLLGRTLTTSELARVTQISLASASEHASVLRTAALLESTRQGPRVYHRLTAIGAALAAGNSGVTFTGGAAHQIDPDRASPRPPVTLPGRRS